jgi:hypothetical protein
MKLLNFIRDRFRWIDKMGQQITDPIKFRRLNGWLVVFWAAMIPISIVTGLISMLAYVTVLSLYANFATHLGAWAASRAEARQVDVDTDEVDVDAQHAKVRANDVEVNKVP